MSLGWLYGKTYDAKHGMNHEAKRFMVTGISCLTLFFVLRIAQIGDYLLSDGTFQGFMGLSKYPPSPDYVLFNLGVIFSGFFLLNKLTKTSRTGQILENFGQTPLFFYNTHLWVYAGVPAILNIFNSLSLTQGVGIWLIGLLILYPLCCEYLVKHSSVIVHKRKTRIAQRAKPVRRPKLKDFSYFYGKE